MTKESKATGIKTWPEDDRPREKLLKKGAKALSNSEQFLGESECVIK